jgi:hypothetical protein
VLRGTSAGGRLVFTSVANCVHGFPQSQCLICQTLGTSSPAKPGKATKVAEPRGNLLIDDDLGRSLPANRALSAASPSPRRSGKTTLLAGVGVIVVGGLLILAFGGIFELAFHIFEFAALALVAGWAGYKLGHYRGRRERTGKDRQS